MPGPLFILRVACVHVVKSQVWRTSDDVSIQRGLERLPS